MFGLNKHKKKEEGQNKGLPEDFDLNNELNNVLNNLGDFLNTDDAEPQDESPIQIYKRLAQEAKELLTDASDLEVLGPGANTPLAKLLDNQVITSSLLSVMMSPGHTDTEKLRMITAVICVGLKKYSIAITE